jgi:hypothetical protein
VAEAQHDRGYGPWRLGMSKSAVRDVAEFAPYRDVASTGGLETSNGLFDGRTTNISFVFEAGGLRKTQIWAYEGQSLDDAIDAWHRVRGYLLREYGPLRASGFEIAADISREEFAPTVREALKAQPRSSVAKLQVAPVTGPAGVSVFSSFFRLPSPAYLVFLYYQDP